MLRALSNAASGMKAQEMNIDVLSNNLANVNTAGYKRSRAEFADLFYEARRRPGAMGESGDPMPGGLELGYGTRAVATHREFSGGELRQTGNPLDLAIEGRGFFQVMQPDGQVAYTRAGYLKTNAEGQLVNSDGYVLEPEISIPAETTGIAVSESGVVSVTLGGETEYMELGRIQLATFANEAGLAAAGRGLFLETPASGSAMLAAPAEEGCGRLLQGFIETSNVSVVNEMIELIAAQRAYEINAKVITAADEMLQRTTRLG